MDDDATRETNEVSRRTRGTMVATSRIPSQVIYCSLNPTRTPEPPSDDVQFRPKHAHPAAYFDAAAPDGLEMLDHAPRPSGSLETTFLPQ